jgi:hypothetical protein
MSIELIHDKENQRIVIVEFADLLCAVPESVCKQAIKAGLDVIQNAVIPKDPAPAVHAEAAG